MLFEASIYLDIAAKVKSRLDPTLKNLRRNTCL
jgi:hypothetical protein